MSQVLLLLPQVVCLLHLHQDPLCQGVQVGREPPQPSWHYQLAPFESLPPPQEGAIVKHVLGVGVQGPEVALARVARFTSHLDETVVEAEVVPDAVLPGGEPGPVVGEPASDELTDAVEGESLVWGLDDGHGDHCNVGVRRLDVLVLWVRLTCCSGSTALLFLIMAPLTDLLLKRVFFRDG